MHYLKSFYWRMIASPIKYAKHIGVEIGENCLIATKKWPSEPYLIKIGNNVQITNEVYLKLYSEMLNKFGTLEEFLNQCKRKKQSIKFSDIKAQTTEIDENNPFYNKAVAITGTLEKMQRKEAMQIIANLGGICQDNVNKETNCLILGNNDYNPQLRGEKSNKLIKAEKLKLKGNDIEIMSENVFYDILDEYYTRSEE